MSDTLNKAMVIGNVVRDAEIYNGTTPILSFTVATSERYRTRNGENKEVTDYLQVKMFGGLALELHPKLTKGTKVFVSGCNKGEPKAGTDGVKKTWYYIKADDIRVYPAVTKGGESTRSASFTGGSDPDDDIPF